MLFNTPKVILYLKDGSLELYSQDGEIKDTLNFPAQYQDDQEIVDKANFQQLLSNFLAKQNFKKTKPYIVISPSLLYEKLIPISSPENQKALSQKFFAEVPFDTFKIAKKEIKGDKEIKLIATNKNLYEIAVKSFETLNLKPEAVLPSTVFGVTSTKLTKEDIKKIISNTKLQKQSNFQDIIKEKGENNTQENQQSSKRKYLLLAGLVFIALGLVVIALMLFKPSIL